MSSDKPPKGSENFAGMLILGLLAGATVLFVANALLVVILVSALKITNTVLIFSIGNVAAVILGFQAGWRTITSRSSNNGFLVGCAIGLLGATSLCEVML